MPLYRKHPHVPVYIPRPRYVPTKIPPDLGESGGNPHITSELDTNNVATYNFVNTIAWAANSPLVLTVINTDADAAELPSTVTTTGLTWLQFATVSYDASLIKRITCYYANPTSSGSNTLSVTFSEAQTCCSYSVEQYLDMDNTSACIVQYKTGFVTAAVAGPFVVGFDNPLGTGNQWQFSGGIDTNTTLTQETGWTELAQNGNGSPAHRWIVAWRTTKDLTPSMSVASGSKAYGIIAFEIKAGTPATSVSPLLRGGFLLNGGRLLGGRLIRHA